MQKEGENNFVHLVGFGKGESFAHQASQSLAQSAVEAFDMFGARFGVALGELVLGDDLGIRFPDVGKTVGFLVSLGNGVPQLQAGFPAAIADGDGRWQRPPPAGCDGRAPAKSSVCFCAV